MASVSSSSVCLDHLASWCKKFRSFDAKWNGWELNPGHLACAASALPLSYDNRITTSHHNSLYVLHRWYWNASVAPTGSHSVRGSGRALTAQARCPGFNSQCLPAFSLSSILPQKHLNCFVYRSTLYIIRNICQFTKKCTIKKDLSFQPAIWHLGCWCGELIAWTIGLEI